MYLRASKPSVLPARPTHRTALPAILAASVIPQLFVAPPTCIAPSAAPPGYGVNWLTSAGGSTLVPTSNCISCAANISNCSACNLANGVPLNSYASVPACGCPGAVPSGYGPNSTDPTRIYSLRGCSLHNLCCQRLEPLACKLADGYLLDPYTAIPSCVLQPESQQATEPTRATTPECTHAQKPTALHAAPTPSNCSVCDSQPTATLWILLVPPTCVKTPNIPSGLVSNQLIIRKFIPSDAHCDSCMPTTRTALPATPRMATSCTFHRPTKLCHASDSSIRVRSERHRLLQSVPACLENQVSRLQGQRIELFCLVISPCIGHPQLVRCNLRPALPPLLLPPGYGVNSADQQVLPLYRLELHQPAANISNCSATSRTESCSTLLRQRACLYQPRCSPIRLRSQPRLTQPESTLAWMLTAQPSCQRLNCSACKLADGIPVRPVHRDSILRSSAGIPAGYGANSKGQHPEVNSMLSLPHCMQRQRLELFCLRLRSQWLLGSLPSAANLCQDTELPIWIRSQLS